MSNNMVYDNRKIDFTKEPIFFGSGKNIQRYDVQKYQFFEKAALKMMKLYWQPEEITLVKDVLDYKNMLEHEKRIFKLTLSYQILLDSYQGRNPVLTFGRITTLPEFEQVTIIWDFYEMIHSRSYSHILRNLLTDCNSFFDDIILNEKIKARAESVTKYGNELYDLINIYENPNSVEQISWNTPMIGEKRKKEFMRKLKKAVYMSLISVIILEGVRFYISFACSFAFAENQKMVGNAKIIKLIARDENEHLALTMKLCNILRKEVTEGFTDIAAECEEEAREMFRLAMEEENDWADYIMEDGSMLGLNADLLKQYTMHRVYKVMTGIGLKPVCEKLDQPFPWIEPWLSSKGVETQLQESENTSYLIASIDMNNVSDEDYKFTLS